MPVLISACAALLTLLGLPAALAHAHPQGASPVQQRLELARTRQARHAQAMACGDPSRSPYHRLRGPAGQSGSRHGEQEWYRELIAQR